MLPRSRIHRGTRAQLDAAPIPIFELVWAIDTHELLVSTDDGLVQLGGYGVLVAANIGPGSFQDGTYFVPDSLIVGEYIEEHTSTTLTVCGGEAVPVWIETDDTAGTGIQLYNTSEDLENELSGGKYQLVTTGATGGAAYAGGFGIYDNTEEEYRLFINKSGNMGIGKFPECKLDVNGEVRALDIDGGEL